MTLPAAPAVITAACFPVPGLLLRTNNTTAQQLIRDCAQQQSTVASRLHHTLITALHRSRDTAERATAFEVAFTAAEGWRYRAAASSRHPEGRYSARWAERFRTPITDDNPNLFRIGEPARFRDGAVWDPDTRTYQGGTETPASRTMRDFEAHANARFAQTSEGDVVRNHVALPDGRIAEGMCLLRGRAAHQAAAEMATRIAARGGDTSRIITDGHLIYCATGPQADRQAIRHQAMGLLATEHPTPAAALAAWLQAAYLLYQAPRTKRGADAATRTFLIAAGASVLPSPPVLVHDIDLRAYVRTQDAFVAEQRAAQEDADR
ncbi:hypothetical protein OG819_55690 [Streptomyces sp. NBC_01549]|uniref:hypothetical protein n=1 Tax=Streptomyces sp. NBC_01549 TaxID=2975874 RepID=UPI00225B7119|nr:hypothetical protein [Streptomyces sp. NBC_01549]MCX4598399.1 hypothetical protein [Streptomyces sp. NBC_01549]